MLPGYGPHLRGRLKEMELKALSDEDGFDRARDLDADEVEARAERRRLEREAAEHAHEAPDDAR